MAARKTLDAKAYMDKYNSATAPSEYNRKYVLNFPVGPPDGTFSLEQRRAVYDIDVNKCWMCGERLAWDHAQIDHVIPQKLGGRNVLENARTLCISCHKKKTSAERELIKEAPSVPAVLIRFIEEVLREVRFPSALKSTCQVPASIYFSARQGGGRSDGVFKCDLSALINCFTPYCASSSLDVPNRLRGSKDPSMVILYECIDKAVVQTYTFTAVKKTTTTLASYKGVYLSQKGQRLLDICRDLDGAVYVSGCPDADRIKELFTNAPVPGTWKYGEPMPKKVRAVPYGDHVNHAAASVSAPPDAAAASASASASVLPDGIVVAMVIPEARKRKRQSYPKMIQLLYAYYVSNGESTDGRFPSVIAMPRHFTEKGSADNGASLRNLCRDAADASTYPLYLAKITRDGVHLGHEARKGKDVFLRFTEKGSAAISDIIGNQAFLDYFREAWGETPLSADGH